MIDLHLHTTASDGRCSPSELVERAAAAGVTVMGVTDHDTTAGIGEVLAAARPRQIEVVAGIEVTAVESGRDVHVLGYFIDADDVQLAEFLKRQRQQRIARVKAVGDRLARLGMPIDIAPLIAKAEQDGGRSIGRPQIARAMIAAGYVTDTRDAFDRWLATGRPAFVPRAGAPPRDVIAIVHAAGGLAVHAHPGSVPDQDLMKEVLPLVDGLEVYTRRHRPEQIPIYEELAARHGLLMTVGSDADLIAWLANMVELPEPISR